MHPDQVWQPAVTDSIFIIIFLTLENSLRIIRFFVGKLFFEILASMASDMFG
jgi:hypothetical protein